MCSISNRAIVEFEKALTARILKNAVFAHSLPRVKKLTREGASSGSKLTQLHGGS